MAPSMSLSQLSEVSGGLEECQKVGFGGCLQGKEGRKES